MQYNRAWRYTSPPRFGRDGGVNIKDSTMRGGAPSVKIRIRHPWYAEYNGAKRPGDRRGKRADEILQITSRVEDSEGGLGRSDFTPVCVTERAFFVLPLVDLPPGVVRRLL